MYTKINSSSELMTNYIQGETVSPDKKFTALQSDKGNSLLFSISSDGVFYLTEEKIGNNLGWQRSNLSASINSFFPQQSSIIAKSFAVDQHTSTNNFSVVLAVTVDQVDHLFIATQYNRDETENIQLEWVALPFDAKESENEAISITDIYIMQTDAIPLIIVNATAPGDTQLARYYIDSNKDISDRVWNLYTLPVDMDADSAALCGGRRDEESIDGIYSLGKIGAMSKVFYQQIYNPYNPKAPGATSQFNAGITPEAIASTLSATRNNNSTSNYTDLYVSTAEGELLLFTADNQSNNAKGLNLMNNELFIAVVNLYAYTTQDEVVVWGLNRSQQVFYTQCPIDHVTDPNAWSHPLPIASKIEQISPYKNRINGGNTYFMHTGNNTLKKATQDPISSSWITQDLLLDVSAASKSEKYDCYMTRLTMYDNDNTPVAGAPVQISSAYRVPLYINNRYYVLDTTPITVEADTQGAVKLVQSIENLQGARLFIQNKEGSIKTMVNPMNNAVEKVANLDSADALAAAQVTDDKGTVVQPLVSSTNDQQSLESAAESIQSLVQAYTTYNTEPNSAAKKVSQPGDSLQFKFSPAANVFTLAVRPSSFQMNIVQQVGDTLSDIGDAIVVAAGDLCNWLLDTAEYVIQIIEDTAQKVWNFVATIGGKLYTFVINTVEKAIAALEAIFNALKTLVSSLIQFLKFLFSWDDITRTNDLFVNIIKLYLDYGVEHLADVRGTVNESIANMIEGINDWANITVSPQAEFANQPMSYQQAQVDYTNASSAPNTYLQDHFSNNIANARYLEDEGQSNHVIIDTLQDAVETLMTALKNELTVLKISCEAINTQLFNDDRYKTLSLAEILKTLTAILADTMLASAGVVIDALIDLLVDVAEGIVSFFTKPIWIPVVSDILAAIFGYEIDFSLLDIVCLVGSIPATLTYKLTNGQAPFSPDDGFSTQIIEAKSLEELQKTLAETDQPTYKSTDQVDLSKGFDGFFNLQQNARETIFITSHLLSATIALSKCPLLVLEDMDPLPYTPFISPAVKICDVVQNVSYGMASMFAQPYPIQNSAISKLSTILTVCTIITKVSFAVSYGVNRANIPVKSSIAMVDGTVDLVLSMASIAPTIYHFVELAEIPSNSFRNLAITGETAKLSNYLSNIARDIGKFDPDPDTGVITVSLATGLTLLNSGLQYSESFATMVVID